MNCLYIKEYSYEKLDYLRRNTKLNPKDYLKVIKKRLEAIHNQKMYQKCVPNYQIEVDYREANFTEYLLRMMVWENKFADTWFKYGNGMSKEEYVVMALNGLIREEKIIRRR